MNLVNMPRASWKRQPIYPVRLDRNNELATRLKHLVVPFGLYPRTSGNVTDFFGNIAPDFGNASIDGLQSTVISGERFVFPYGDYVGTNYSQINFPSPITASDDITVFSRLWVIDTTSDYGLVSFNDGAWSWLDQSGGVLRISAYTTYDTTNVISTSGVHDVGLIWKANNQYQTVLDGKFSQSGTVTRRSFTGICGPHRGSLGWATASGGDTKIFGAAFWGVWSRALSEGETRALSENPWQLFVAQTSRSYFIPADVAATLPTLSGATAINITSSGFQPRVTATY